MMMTAIYEEIVGMCMCLCVCVSVCVSKGMFERLAQSSHHPVTARGLWVIGSVPPETM